MSVSMSEIENRSKNASKRRVALEEVDKGKKMEVIK